jgi:hypothetical protein
MTKIIIKIEGMPEEGGHIDFHDFISQLRIFSSTFFKLDLIASGDKKPSTKFRIVSLSHESPATIGIEAIPLPKRRDTVPLIERQFKESYTAVKTGHIPNNMDIELLKNFKEICKPIGKSIFNSFVSFNDDNFDFNANFGNRVQIALEVEEECYGTVSGYLEKLNIHSGANIFTIYPEVGAGKIECKIPTNLVDDAIGAVGRKVEMSGILKYIKNANFPHLIHVSSIEAFPSEDELPDLFDLRGKAPDATGKQTAVEFIREIRDAWV